MTEASLAATPGWIRTPSGQCFAWYHRPLPARARSCAVLLCDPFGWNRMVLHLAYRMLALRLCEAGYAVLRIDYPGTCDSEGWPRDRARVEAWLSCLDAGADRLLEWSGARELAAFGALLGGTMATLLSARRSDVKGLVLWGAHAQGRSMIRTEMAATAMRSAGAGRPPPGHREGDQEALGFLLTQSMAGDLRAIDLLTQRVAQVRHALVLPRFSGAPDRRLAEHLAMQGAAVDCRDSVPDELEPLLHQGGAGLPEATVEEVAAWLDGAFPERAPVPRASAPGPAPEVDLHEAGGVVRESIVQVGPDSIFGILAQPVAPGGNGLALLLVNGGHNHRAGINRNYTEWARRFAVRGHQVLRIDVRGLGDSAPPPGSPPGRLYTDEGTQDVLNAVRWLRDRGAEDVCCAGLCAGGYHAFHAALRDPSIPAVIMLNPLRFHADRADARPARGLPRVVSRIKDRLPRGIRTWAAPEQRVARSFAFLAARSVDVRIVYNANEGYREFLEGALHSVRHELHASGRFRIEQVDPSDHIFSPLWAQAEVSERLDALIQELTRDVAAKPQTKLVHAG